MTRSLVLIYSTNSLTIFPYVTASLFLSLTFGYQTKSLLFFCSPFLFKGYKHYKKNIWWRKELIQVYIVEVKDRRLYSDPVLRASE